jgi:hypothetical protein
MRVTRLEHRFVDEIPVELEEATLYISMRNEVAVHRCASGCGLDVVTPLGRGKGNWSFFFDGAVTLRPSVGNWNYECRSHYVITRGEVLWIERWDRRWPTLSSRPKDQWTAPMTAEPTEQERRSDRVIKRLVARLRGESSNPSEINE